MMLEHRSTETEIMDDLEISGPVIDQTLKELDIINRRLGGNQISTSVFRKLLRLHGITSVADLGCGGADILIAMARIAKKQGKDVNFTGIDANPHIVEYAERHVSAWPNIRIACQNIFSPEFRSQSFDVIHCCLFTHHFTHGELTELLGALKQQTRVAILINDLHRHWLAWYAIKWITRFFSKSYMVRNDAAVSVARGFKRNELIAILRAAGIRQFTIRWRWAFRWQVVIRLT